MSVQRKYHLLWRFLLLWTILFLVLVAYHIWKYQRRSEPVIQIALNEPIFDDVLPTLASKHNDSHLCTKAVFKNDSLEQISNSVTCKQLNPVIGSCNLTYHLYGPNSATPTCAHQPHLSICNVTVTNRDPGFAVKCTLPQECSSEIHLGVFRQQLGDIHWTNISDISVLQKVLQAFLSKNVVEDNFGFVFLKCKYASSEEEERRSIYLDEEANNVPMFGIQLLVIPPNFLGANYRKSKKFINVNLIMIDSVSHVHFYRMLPKTLATLREMPNVLDFELYQAIKHRTFESLEALFTGFVDKDEKPFGTYDMPPRPLAFENLMSHFKARNYTTLYLEDLCWNWEWGITKDLLVHDFTLTKIARFQKLLEALTKANIDDIGITLASCDILNINGYKDPFHGPPSVCYNGIHHHEYMLTYLEYFQRRYEPFFTFVTSSVSHEDSGLRLKTLDTTLSQYLEFAKSNLKNTVTFLFSDHGNSYGKYVSSSVEGRVEMYHPFLFIVVPDEIKRRFPAADWLNLLANQKKLVSLVDVHYSLMHLLYLSTKYVPVVEKTQAKQEFRAKYVTPKGLFGSIPDNRTCDSIPRLNPSICICEDYETAAEITDEKLLLAEYAIGMLNNILWSQYRRQNKGKSLPACQKLIGTKIDNIREVFNRDSSKIVKMQVFVSSIDGYVQNALFFFSIQVPLSDKANSGFRLLGFERLTSYSHFAKCADKGVNIKLCLCSKRKTPKFDVPLSHHGNMSRFIFDTFNRVYNYFRPPRRHAMLSRKLIKAHPFAKIIEMSSFLTKGNFQCLNFLSRKYEAGVAMELVNECENSLHLAFDVDKVNMVSSVPLPFQVFIEPGVNLFLMSLIQINEKEPWTWKFAIKYIPN